MKTTANAELFCQSYTDYIILIIFTDSQPFKDFEQGATGGEDIQNLRLDDDNEFPPMTHKTTD